jgi:hypothetical protein
VPAPSGPSIITDPDDVDEFLDAASGGENIGNAVYVPMGVVFPTDWPDLLAEIAYSDKYVALDLSACTMTEGTGGEFDPNAANTNGRGKDKIVSLVLPDAATKVKSSFSSFTNLTSVSGEGVETIKSAAFAGSSGLSSVDFPAATTIEFAAFADCANLTTVDCPAATTIGNSAFYNCAELTEVNFLGEATDDQPASIGNSAFYGCTKLETVTVTAATIIDYSAFYNCISLTTASFPAAETINYNAFYNCTSLSALDLRSAKTFGYGVFIATGTEPLTVTLGTMAPAVGHGMFDSVSSAKSVTVRVPDGAEGYGDIPKTYPNEETAFNNYAWGDGFRGAGWTQNGSFVNFGSCNDSITVSIQSFEEPEEQP